MLKSTYDLRINAQEDAKKTKVSWAKEINFFILMYSFAGSAVVRVTNRRGFDCHWHHDAVGKDGKPGKTEENDDKFVVVEEGTNANDEQQDSSWHSERIHRLYAAYGCQAVADGSS